MRLTLKSTTQPEIKLNFTARTDLLRLLEIERASFEQPWSKEDFLDFLSDKKCLGITARAEGRIVGFAMVSMLPRAIELFAIAVHPDYRRKGIGSALLSNLKEKLNKHKPKLVAEVRDSMLPVHLFLKANNLTATEVLRDRFSKPTEDGYAMEYRR